MPPLHDGNRPTIPGPGDLITATRGGKTFKASRRTFAHLDDTIVRLAKAHPKTSLRVIQGCYNTGVAASAGTHDYDACLDVQIVGLSWGDAQTFLRKCGWAAWHRTPAQGFSDHIHMVSIGYPGRVGIFVPAQVDDYRRHALGLKGHHNSGADRSWFPPDIGATVFQYDAWLKKQLVPMKPPPKVPAKWSKFLHAEPYRLGNSIRGLDLAKKQKVGAIDLDAHVTKDGVVVNTHWSLPMKKEGFVDPLGKINPNTPIWELTWAQVARLRTPDGYRIHTMRAMLRLAAARGLRVELEAKDSPGFNDAEVWVRLHRVVKRLKVNVQMKTLSNLKGYRFRLAAAHDAGFTTILLPRDTGKKPIPRSLWPHIDYVRGPVTWTGPVPKEKP